MASFTSRLADVAIKWVKFSLNGSKTNTGIFQFLKLELRSDCQIVKVFPNGSNFNMGLFFQIGANVVKYNLKKLRICPIFADCNPLSGLNLRCVRVSRLRLWVGIDREDKTCPPTYHVVETCAMGHVCRQEISFCWGIQHGCLG